MTITRQGNGFLISIGTGKKATARTLQEVAYALEHYFRQSCIDQRFDYSKHLDHSKECDCCPLCRLH